MSDSEEEELAALRRERNARLGITQKTTVDSRKKEVQGDGQVAREQPSMDEEALRAMFPSSFGGVKIQSDVGVSRNAVEKDEISNGVARKGIEVVENENTEVATAGDDDFIGPPLPVSDDEKDAWNLPVSSEVELDAHGKAVISLDVDHSGSRVITGSTDYTVKIFDFNGMKSDFKAFRTIEPSEGHPVLSLSWSPTGDAFLVVTGSAQPKIFNRDGHEEGEFVRGDMYIRDMKNTKGHVTSCTGGQWHPSEKGCAITSSADGTIRVWDTWNMAQNTVIKPTLRRPGRVSVTAVTYNSDGKLIAGGLMDGTIQVWDVRGKVGHSSSTGMVAASAFQRLEKQKWTILSRAGQVVRGAHEEGNEITSLSASHHGQTLLSRGADSTLKLWDLRKFKSPIASVDNLDVGFSNAGCCFSPGDDFVLTGVGATKGGDGYLSIFNATDLSLVKRLGAPGNVVPVTWHHKLNQIFYGCGDRKHGAARILYDTDLSTSGALLAVGRRPRTSNLSDYTANIQPEIYNPNALPLFKVDWKTKKRYNSDAPSRDPKLFKPDPGQSNVTRGAGGKLGTSSGSLLTQYLMKNKGALKNPAEEDVRASILRHADKEDEFQRFTDAYAKTQPTRIYAEEEEEEDDEDQGEQGPVVK